MTEKDLRKLGRQDLLQMLVTQSREVARQRAALKELEISLNEADENTDKLRNRLDEKDETIERLKERLYDYSEEDLKRCFTLDAVLNGLFRLSRELFGVEVDHNSGRRYKNRL